MSLEWLSSKINAVESSLIRNLNRIARKQILIFVSSVSPLLNILIKNKTNENILFTILSLIPDPLGQLIIKTDLGH